MEIVLALVVGLGFLALMIASGWKIFEKAGKEGWQCLVPFHNTIVTLDIIGKPGTWVFLLFIPYLGSFIMHIILSLGLASKFGKGTGFAVGLIIIPFVFLPLLAFSDAQYESQGGMELEG